MTDQDPPSGAAELAEKLAAESAELARTHQRLREQRAAAGDLSAAVHDEAARVHEQLGDRSLLDPDDLRAHARRDREMAAAERSVLADEQEPTS